MLNILSHLPRNLPEAFDQALGRISDPKYGDRIFQLVAVAKTPLTGEQLNVALNVQPGNVIWNGTKLPSSFKQVVARCGGGLLEVDEEDSCVRFIHHSVVSHLGSLRVGMNGRRLARNWIADAEAFMGSVCVTYLNFPEFDRRMVLSRNLNPSSMSEALKKEVSASNPILANVVRHIKKDKHRRVAPEQLNIFPLLLAAQKANEDTITCFLPYASEYWVQHTARLTEEDGAKIDILWRELVNNRPPHISVPWNPSLDPLSDEGGMLEYAISHSHAYLYRFIIRSFPDAKTFLSTVHWLLEKTPALNDGNPWLTEMINCFLASGPSFIPAAYWFALIYNSYVCKIGNNSEVPYYALRLGSHLAGITVENATDRLWAMVEEACSLPPTSEDGPQSVRHVLVATLDLLAMLRLLPESPIIENRSTARDAFGRSLNALFRDGNEDDSSTSILWNSRVLVTRANDAEDFDSWAFREAFKRNNFQLIKKIATKGNAEESILEQTLEEAKRQAESMLRPKFLLGRLKEPATYVMDQQLVEDPTLAVARTYMANKEYDNVLDTMHRYTKLSGAGVINKNLIIQIHVAKRRMVLRWVITHRCEMVLRKLSFLRQAVLDWPTVLIYAITTYAHAKPPNNEDAESECSIFFGLLEVMKKIDPKGNRTMSFMGGLDDDPGWTALHAAALWQPFAVKALLETWPDLVNAKTRRGLTPLVVALCGQLETEDAFETVYALLHAGADTGPLWAFSYLSPLDISIAYRPCHISQFLAEFGATRAEPLEGTLDLPVHTLLKIIALLESRKAFWGGDSTKWAKQVQKATALDEYYCIQFRPSTPPSIRELEVSSPLSLPTIEISPSLCELEGCNTMHFEDQGCHCNKLHSARMKRLFNMAGERPHIYEVEGCGRQHPEGQECECSELYKHVHEFE